MPAAYKTPGVYIVEKNAFPPSVVAVATAVPAFVGYTKKADNKGRSLLNKAFKITSMSEFNTYFGGPPLAKFSITAVPSEGENLPEADFSIKVNDPAKPDGPSISKPYYLTQTSGKFLLYYGMLQFFQNGGGPCYIVSVGDYDATPDKDALVEKGIKALESELEPTMLVAPDAVLLDAPACIAVQQQMLAHCGTVMRNRFAILDIHNGDKPRTNPDGDPIDAFRDKLGINNLDYGAAYYPWLNTTIVEERDFGLKNIDDLADLVTVLTPATDDPKAALWQKPSLVLPQEDSAADPVKLTIREFLADTTVDTTGALITQATQSLAATNDVFAALQKAMARKLNLLPPSAAMAGLYTFVDNGRGVWKAPANVSVNSVVSPAVPISHYEQEDLNVTPMGKSINAIRSFIGEGVLVWGARTLDGNSLDWRYINVRRTMIFLEESCRLAAKAMVFEPNVAGTWLTIRAMIENFLTSVWRQGGLAGAVPEDAFSVHVGLGDTMTADDILEGILRVTVLVAISHPAEFIEITFQQQMQKS